MLQSRMFLPDPAGQREFLQFLANLQKLSDNLDLYVTLASVSGK